MAAEIELLMDEYGITVEPAPEKRGTAEQWVVFAPGTRVLHVYVGGGIEVGHNFIGVVTPDVARNYGACLIVAAAVASHEYKPDGGK